MIEVDRLTKRYGACKAVAGVSFSADRGEVVGLLGPNGAGKTTTMRMLTTYLAPTSGRARVAGKDVLDEPLEVRKRVGYLPESVPLYVEMRVREYLSHRAALKDVPRSRRRSVVASVVERCRLGDVETRIIGQLSRGYRQRVGLADALLHDPEVLILDEPTSGLDPIQIREVRNLIVELGEAHSVLLSTHILSEVEAVCGRVVVIASGRIVLDEPLDEQSSRVLAVVEARGPIDAIRAAAETAAGVERVTRAERDGDHATLEILAREGQDPREAISMKLAGNGWPIRRLDLRRSSLEERFTRAVSQDALKGGRREGE